jgi:ribose transport system permease protein
MLSGGLAGLAGAYSYIRLGAGSNTSGMGMELYAIAAVVIGGASLMGGVGRIVGIALGTLVLFVVQSGLLTMTVVQVSPDLKQVIVAILIAAAVAVQTLQNKNGRK